MADNTKRLSGTAYLTVDGKGYLLVGDFSWSPSKVTRDSLVGMDGVHGYSEKPVQGFMSGALRDTGALTVADFNDMTNVTVTVELANGKTVVGRNMWTTGAQEVNSGEATVSVRWEGVVEEI